MFFLIVATLANPNVIKLSQPKSQGDTKAKQTVVVSIDANKQFYVGTTPVSLDSLKAALLPIISKEKTELPTIVINADKVRLTGKKMTDKVYIRHTGYPGGQRFATPREVLIKNPRGVVESAVKGMLPKNRLGRELFNNLFVYAGSEHPHAAQQPKEIKF